MRTVLFWEKMPVLMVTFIIVICVAATGGVYAQGQFGTIQGKVTEAATGNPLTGANVYIQDTRMGSVTDSDGFFEIVRVPPGNYALQISFVGYKAEERTVTIGAGQSVTVNVELVVDVLGLDEIVVTGMGGTQIKEKLGVTIAKVSAQSIVNSNESNVVAAMAGKVANVEITTSSGEPGSSTYIRIRGANTVTGGTQPLFVVDGIPINNSTRTTEGTTGGTIAPNRASDINPEDIESIEILKGAAAAAIYGSRAANGVVLITTKSGRPGKTRISYKASYSWDKINESVPLQRRWGQGNNGAYREGYAHSWGAEIPAGTPTYDHAWEMFETGHVFENVVTISGGNEFTTFFLSAGNFDNDGAIKGNSDYTRQTIRLKARQVINDKLSIEGNVSYSRVEMNMIQRGSNVAGLLLGSYRTPPEYNNLPYVNDDGLHISYRNSNPTTVKESRGFDNPFFVLHEHTNQSDVGRFIGSSRIEYDPFEWLNVNYTLGFDSSLDERLTVLPPGNSSEPVGYLRNTDFKERELDHNLIATVKLGQWLNKFNDNISGTLMGGHNLNSRSYHRFRVDGYDMGNSTFLQLDNTAEWDPNEYEYLIHTESYFAQLTLDFYEQLFLTGAARNDGSSTFSQNDQRFWYPKFSAAWEFTKLEDFPEIPYLNYGKVRFAYGEAGRQPNVYSMITGYSGGSYGEGWGPSVPVAYLGAAGFRTSGTKAQENIKPERVKEYESGLDLAFWESRIGLDVTYYKSKSQDMIFSLPLPASTGYTTQSYNAAELENKGWEIGIEANPVMTRNFSWNINLLWARNKNKCLSLPGAEYLSLGGFTDTQGAVTEGKPVGVFRLKDWIRFGNSTNVIMKDGSTVSIDAAYPNAPAGSVYIDEDGMPVIDSQYRYKGDPNPDWTGSIRNDFRLFNKVTISTLFDIKHGGDIWNGTRGALSHYGTHITTIDRDTRTRVFEGYGPGAGIVVPMGQNWYKGRGSGFSQATDYIEDGGYVKLREIAVAYTFEHDFIKEYGLSSIDIRLAGRNLKTWTDYTGIDPETNLGGTGNYRGFDYFQNPQTKSYILTLRFNY